jgi:hypothetical protein
MGRGESYVDITHGRKHSEGEKVPFGVLLQNWPKKSQKLSGSGGWLAIKTEKRLGTPVDSGV